MSCVYITENFIQSTKFEFSLTYLIKYVFERPLQMSYYWINLSDSCDKVRKDPRFIQTPRQPITLY